VCIADGKRKTIKQNTIQGWAELPRDKDDFNSGPGQQEPSSGIFLNKVLFGFYRRIFFI
jgi:hypothetical protein